MKKLLLIIAIFASISAFAQNCPAPTVVHGWPKAKATYFEILVQNVSPTVYMDAEWSSNNGATWNPVKCTGTWQNDKVVIRVAKTIQPGQAFYGASEGDLVRVRRHCTKQSTKSECLQNNDMSYPTQSYTIKFTGNPN